MIHFNILIKTEIANIEKIEILKKLKYWKNWNILEIHVSVRMWSYVSVRMWSNIDYEGL